MTLTHSPATFGDTVNLLVEAGFWIGRVIEPTLTDEQRREFPHKQRWMDSYAGTLIMRARPRVGERAQGLSPDARTEVDHAPVEVVPSRSTLQAADKRP